MPFLLNHYAEPFTDDFQKLSTNERSAPLNIVIKLNTAAGHPAIKISDNIGKNTGDSSKVAQVKQVLGYKEAAFNAGDEAHRWDAAGGERASAAA